MTYNIHPLFVHFPIALLFVYSIIKILPFKRWFSDVSWSQIERALLVVGVLGAFAALATGDTAEHIAQANYQLVDMHSTFAGVATALYVMLLVGEMLRFINPKFLPKISVSWIKKLAVFLEKTLTNTAFSKLVALLALVAISVTGLLGGVIVYGISADPVAGIVLKILGIHL